MESPENTHRSAMFQDLSCRDSGMDILSCSRLEIFETVNLVFLCNIIGVFGIGANVINIIVFFKQGFTSTVNISFFGLAISDLCCLITLLWVCMCLNPFIIKSGVPWVAEEFMYLPGAWPHVVCGRITSYITVIITAERCICIIAPLKVKQIITPKTTTVIICLIYVINILTLIPEYATSYLEFTFLPERNKTLLSMSFTSNREEVVGLVFFLSSITGMVSFVAVIAFTVILAVKLKQTSDWRKKATSNTDQRGFVSSRDKKTVKMVTLIASVLIVCYTPGSVVGMATFVEPELNLRGRYINLGMSIWTIAFVFQTVNSSVNILLYYHMSSKYRQTFDEFMCRNLKAKK